MTALAAFIAVTAVSSVDLPAVRGSVLAWSVVWFIIGYALYATVFGALGSLASRPEDAQSAAGPVSVGLILVYFISFAAIGSANTNWARAVAWFPASAPIAMPSRIAMGTATWWDPFVALALTGAAIAALVVLGGRVYAGAVLHSGPTLKLRDVWRSTSTVDDAAGATATPAASTTSVRHTIEPPSIHRNRTAVLLFAATLAIGALVASVSGDVIIGIAVGAALFAIVDRAIKAWAPPSGEADDDRPADHPGDARQNGHPRGTHRADASQRRTG